MRTLSQLLILPAISLTLAACGGGSSSSSSTPIDLDLTTVYEDVDVTLEETTESQSGQSTPDSSSTSGILALNQRVSGTILDNAVDNYLFTAPEQGMYLFFLSATRNDGETTQIELSSSGDGYLGETIEDNGEGEAFLLVGLNADETLSLQIAEPSEFSAETVVSYTLSASAPSREILGFEDDEYLLQITSNSASETCTFTADGTTYDPDTQPITLAEYRRLDLGSLLMYYYSAQSPASISNITTSGFTVNWSVTDSEVKTLSIETQTQSGQMSLQLNNELNGGTFSGNQLIEIRYQDLEDGVVMYESLESCDQDYQSGSFQVLL